MNEKPPLVVQGMHGMGDNLHQRAILRQLMEKHEVWLLTSWVSLYHDLIAQGLHVLPNPTGLRTQKANQSREWNLFSGRSPPRHARRIRISYSSRTPSASGTILEVMCKSAGVNYGKADFTLPVPDEWFKLLSPLPLPVDERPVMVYRPLVVRPEWRGSERRNADPEIYSTLFHSIRDRFFVISVADLHPGKEWTVGPEPSVDLKLHKGELPFEGLAALFSYADLVFTSSGFAAVLAPAVRTPVISICGGYERTGVHDSGKKFAPMLTLGPSTGCNCSVSSCMRTCSKALDLPYALGAVGGFTDQIRGAHR